MQAEYGMQLIELIRRTLTIITFIKDVYKVAQYILKLNKQ